MARFLVLFDRATGEVSVEKFTGPSAGGDAMRARFRAEATRHSSSVEVVVLQALDEADLRTTHRRYFETLSELASSV